MKPIALLFWQICLFRGSPASVPTYSWFLVLIIAANTLLSLAFFLVYTELTVVAILSVVFVQLASLAALIFLALYLNSKAQRFPATITAVIGCDLVLTCLRTVIYPAANFVDDSLSNIVQLVAVIWSIAITGYILHKAMDTHLAIGTSLALLFTLITIVITQSVVRI